MRKIVKEQIRKLLLILSHLLFYLYFNKKNGNMIAYYRCIESEWRKL